MGKQQGASYYDTIYKASSRYRAGYEDLPYLSTWALVLQLIRQEIRKISGTAKIIDIGCGPGQFAEFLSTHIKECNYTGIDFSTEAIELAKNKKLYNDNFRTSFFAIDLTKEENRRDVFTGDIFTALETFEHIENDKLCLSSIPKGALVIITVPTFDDAGHVRFFKSEEEVSNRYGGFLEIQGHTAFVEKIRSWYIVYGYRNDNVPIPVYL